MFVGGVVLIFNLIGTLGAWRPDIDINRVRLLPKGPIQSARRNPHSRRSIFYHDYDNHRSGVSELRPSVPFQPKTLPTPASKTIKVHQPREDPRLYYVSDAYAKEINPKNLNEVLPAIYPGGDVVLPNSNLYYQRNNPLARLQEREFNYIPEEYSRDDFCTKCPRDLTLVAKPGADRVMVPYPRLRSCSGMKVHRNVRYEHMHGPRIGSLLTAGSYSIVGRITLRGKILRHCIMEVRVLTQSCPLPKYLVAHCEDGNKTCSFDCRDTKSALYGTSSLLCGDDNKWMGSLPVCRAQNWCELISPPNHGRVSCKGATVKGGLGEGSTCRVRCERGYRWDRPVTRCRRGSWTNPLNCVYII